MKKFLKVLTPLPLLAILWNGCSGGEFTSCSDCQNYETVSSKQQRDLTPNVNESTFKQLAANNNAFAFDLFSELIKTNPENLFFSPESISEALAMTYAGSKGETKNEMATVLHFDMNDTLLHKSFNALDLHLNHTDANYTFNIADSLWLQKDFPLQESYLDTLKINYGADVKLVDYLHHNEEARRTINHWVEQKTHARIKNMLSKGMLVPATKLVLVNAVYFKGKWVNEFKAYNTHKDTFYIESNKTIQTNFMEQKSSANYAETNDYQAIALPYMGERTSMVVLLPKAGRYSYIRDNIAQLYPTLSQEMQMEAVDLKMPKFEFSTKPYALKSLFTALGMQRCFNDNEADFSGMTEKTGLYIASIVHKAFIKVDEHGSEAAAATAVIGEANGIIETTKQMIVNRPFLFFIKDDLSGQILFMGAIHKPVQPRIISTNHLNSTTQGYSK